MHGKTKNVVIAKETGETEEIAVMPIYHPAATIYNRKLKGDFDKDFAKLKKIIKEIK